MADTKISALTALAGTDVAAATDVLPIVDTSVTTTKKITVAELLIGLGVTTGSTATTFTFDGSGGTSGSITLTYQKVSGWVTLNIPAVTATTGTNSQALVSNTALPAAFRPAAGTNCSVPQVVNNGAAVIPPGLVVVQTNGIIIFNRDPIGTLFTNTATGGSNQVMTITYLT